MGVKNLVCYQVTDNLNNANCNCLRNSNVGLTTTAKSFSLFRINYRKLVNELELIPSGVAISATSFENMNTIAFGEHMGTC